MADLGSHFGEFVEVEASGHSLVETNRVFEHGIV